jgi:radical SAM/Cys-rich protein
MITMKPFDDTIARAGVPAPLRAKDINVLQLNLGYVCNLSCDHCHLSSGPRRKEAMGRETAEAALQVLRRYGVQTLDITGGSPELNPYFRYLVGAASKYDIHVMVRTNLTLFLDAGMDDLPGFLRRHNVEIIASMPHYGQPRVDRVRGEGVFRKSLFALRMLNGLGYGLEGSGLLLNLVHNPPGALLPGPQKELEAEYRNQLESRFGIAFNRLFVFANMPLGRFREFLVRTDGLAPYMAAVRRAFNPATIEGLMCRSTLSVGWDGRLYDCDFNQALGLTVKHGSPDRIQDFDYPTLAQRPIATGDHCFVCAAGSGSS